MRLSYLLGRSTILVEMAACSGYPSVKLIIFDLDGVLVDSRELHYEALNRVCAFNQGIS
jgi:Haloacid dehalogenase-like hydrolase